MNASISVVYYTSKTLKNGNHDSVSKSVYSPCFFIFANLLIFNKTILILKNYKWDIYKYPHFERRSPSVE